MAFTDNGQPLDQRLVDAVAQQVMELLVPRIEKGTTAAITAALTRQRAFDAVPVFVDSVNGPDAMVIADDNPDEAPFQVTRLNDMVGVDGGIDGCGRRALMLRVPPHGGYLLGPIPDGRPDESEQDSSAFQRRTVTDIARAAGVATDMNITLDLTAGYLYAIHLHSQVTWVTAGVNYCSCYQDGVENGRFHTIETTVGAVGDFIDSICMYAVTDDLEASVFEVRTGSTSAGNMQLAAAAAAPRHLTGWCVGPLSGMAVF